MTAPNPEGGVVLAPCPFCGNDVKSQSFWFGSKNGGNYHVFCLDCAETETMSGPVRDTLEDAIAAWNRRAALQPSPAAPSDELREFALYVSGMMHNLPRSKTADAVNERAQAILAALPPVSGGGLGEPVAWRWKMLGQWQYTDKPAKVELERSLGEAPEPLYARQQAAISPDTQVGIANGDEAETVECETCGGSGKIVEEARTTGANQHSACQHDCEDCDGTGRQQAAENTFALPSQEWLNRRVESDPELPCEAGSWAGDTVTVPREPMQRIAAVLADPNAEHPHDVSYLVEEVEALAAAPTTPAGKVGE